MMIKFSATIFISFILIISVRAQLSDEELHRSLKGDWYSFIFDSLNYNDGDSIYVEYSFLKHVFDYQMSYGGGDWIAPYAIRDGYFIPGDTAANCLECWKARIIVIDSNNVLLYSQDEKIRLRRLFTVGEYTLSDFVHDRLLLGKATYEMRMPTEFSLELYNKLEGYYKMCIIRRDILRQLERGKVDKETIIRELTEFYIDNSKSGDLVQREFKEFIQKIDMLYPDDQP